ncbi:MAG: hypothetical protein BMS9Abin10_1087 [Gammaproteobacteria bacterium]|nr:MAG: hypothetical protein BMS9Abin10_1087 [Gammaproteobacteria bacterium]
MGFAAAAAGVCVVMDGVAYRRLVTNGVSPPYDEFLYFACPKKGTERKGTPDSAPQKPGFPRSALASGGPGKGHSLSLARTHEISLMPLRAWASAAPLTRLD